MNPIIKDVVVYREEFDVGFAQAQRRFQGGLSKVFTRLLDSIKDEPPGTTGVNLYQHSLLTATYADEDGADDETVVCALLHDLSLLLCPYDHEDMVYVLLKQYISEKNQWILQNHALLNRVFMTPPDHTAYEKFKDHPYFKDGMKFGEYDYAAFKNLPHKPLSHFVPMMDRVFSKKVDVS
jgi:predicted HD phosphohydrolase